MDRTTVSTVLCACWLYNVWYWIDRSVFTAYNVVRIGNVFSRVCLLGVGGVCLRLLQTCSDLFHVEVYLLTSGLSAFDWKTPFYCKVKGCFKKKKIFCLLLGWLSTRSSKQSPNISSWATLSTEQETSEYLPTKISNNNELKKKEDILEDIRPYCGVTDTSVWDFWWCLPWGSKQGLILCLRANDFSDSPLVRHLLTSRQPA